MEQLEKPTWVKMSEEELKKIILELSDKYSPSQIGIILRDQYAIPTVKIFGKKLQAYLKELNIEINEDLENATKKVENLKEHFKNNVTDKKAKHKLQRAQARLNITKKYYNISTRDKKKKN
ncbi:MAG: 30S ribosomal protein S15 [Candidatus Nanoarchaeia archaeon]|jgi:small subunit ribosomal protein S15|nr:30S ribosomal protein S15 [Candidatus Nanoarchaeia archaeon]MDD3993649.1 30S ribosomal protein S15 [Candidatus Nanoarchaeia archaeon]MDD4563612.1 30S ribosomal protein S15 [Candidatus Nanoarchaeia archaeon]